jgi:integrase
MPAAGSPKPSLTADRVDLAAGVLVFESLKKRRTGIFRSVPVPPALLDTLDMVHGIRELHARRGKGRGARLWPWSRMTGWRAVHAVMQAAGLEGVPASPKGLRHGFGVAAVTAGIPLNLVQKWLGHAQLSTTAVYANAVGGREGHRVEHVGMTARQNGACRMRGPAGRAICRA